MVLPDVQKSVRTNSAAAATSLSILSLLVPFSLLLLLHWEHMKGLLLAGIFFFRDLQWRQSVEMKPLTQKKTVFHAQCWPQGETFEACKVQMDSLELHVPSNSEHLRQSTCASSYFSKGDSTFFLERPSSPWFVIIRGSPKKKNELLWMISPKEKIWRRWRGTWSGRDTIKSKDTNSVWIL